MVLKRKTVSKVVSALKVPAKVTAKAKAMDTEDIEEAKVVARKMMKKPAAAATGKIEEPDEEATESEAEEESEVEEPKKAPGKMMKKPAAAGAAGGLRQAVAQKMMMKKPAAAAAKSQKKMEVEKSDSASEDSEEDEVSEEEETETSSKVMKKPAARGAKAEHMDVEESEESDEENDEDADEEDAGAQLVPFEKKEPSERELAAERTKELKSMSASDLKELLVSNGLETGTKDAMIKSLLKHEAKVLAAAREQKARIRAVVVKKKQELEDLSIPELGKLCNSAGFKGLKSKPERVQRLLVLWQEEDGVDQALAKIANDERRNELGAWDITKLRKLCNKLEVDPFVKEVMVERISKHENGKGFYARPAVKQGENAPQEEQKLDMVDALLANEAQRKKERALRSQQEEKAAQKRKEIKAMSVEELKKRLVKKGLEATGKRDDMVEALFIAGVQEEAVIERRAALQSKSTQELKELLSLNGLESGSKEQMVKTMLAHEAKFHEDLKAFEAKVGEVVVQKRAQLEGKSNVHLKELCASKGLPVGGERNDKIDRLLDESMKEREFDNIVCMNNRSKRMAELMAMDKPAVLKLCEKADVDPFVKGIMIERIMSQESEGGPAIAAIDEQPAAKKARTSKN